MVMQLYSLNLSNLATFCHQKYFFFSSFLLSCILKRIVSHDFFALSGRKRNPDATIRVLDQKCFIKIKSHQLLLSVACWSSLIPGDKMIAFFALIGFILSSLQSANNFKRSQFYVKNSLLSLKKTMSSFYKFFSFHYLVIPSVRRSPYFRNCLFFCFYQVC